MTHRLRVMSSFFSPFHERLVVKHGDVEVRDRSKVTEMNSIPHQILI